MRLVQLTIPAGKRQTVLDLLDDEGVDYVVTDETSDRQYTAVVYFPLPTNAVEPILDSLEDVGLSDEAYTVVVDAETVVSRKFEKLREERYPADDIEDERISRQELRTEAEELTPTFGIYVTMTVISAVVATAGLLLDSPAVVVGSMVIAPLIGPALAASVGTVVNDYDLFVKGIKYQTLGLGIAVVSGAAFAFLVKTTYLVPPGLELTSVGEINERLTPDMLSLFVAIGAGVAGVLSLSTGLSVALVGVMIAAALIPPAAAAGIALAWGLPMAALGSSVLVLVNVLSVNLAGLLTLWYTGYRPNRWFETETAQRQMLRHVAAFAVAVVVLSGFLVGVTVTSYQVATFEENVRQETEDLLDSPEYAELRLIDVQVVLSEDLPFREPDQVVVTLGQPRGESYPAVTLALADRIDDRAERDVALQVRFVTIEERGTVEGSTADDGPSERLDRRPGMAQTPV